MGKFYFLSGFVKQLEPWIYCVFHCNHKLHSVCNQALTNPRFGLLSYLKQGSCRWLVFLQLWWVFCRRSLPSYLSFFLSLMELAGGKLCSNFCESCFLSHFGGRSLSSRFDAITIMSFVIFKGKFERVACSLSKFRLVRYSSYFKLNRLVEAESPKCFSQQGWSTYFKHLIGLVRFTVIDLSFFRCEFTKF